MGDFKVILRFYVLRSVEFVCLVSGNFFFFNVLGLALAHGTVML